MKKWVILIVVLLVLAPAGVLGYKHFKKHEKPKVQSSVAPSPVTQPPAPAPESHIDTAEIHGLINQERSKAKLRALTVNDHLVDSATTKCEDMKKNNYFTHTSPSGVDYTSFIKKEIPNAKLTGENLGAGYTEDEQLVSEWMQSDQHKANILNPRFTSEGIAVCGSTAKKPGLIIVAHFIQD